MIRLPTLTKGVFAGVDEVHDASDSAVSEKGLLVKMHDPVIVPQHVLVLLQAVLEGPGLVKSP